MEDFFYAGGLRGLLSRLTEMLHLDRTIVTGHSGRAVIFDRYYDRMRPNRRPGARLDRDSVLILRDAGPQGAPGMPKWGMLPIPTKLLEDGVRDMVRISDTRMSGTAYGTCVLHVAPESHVGGPLALVRDGDIVQLDVPGRRLELRVDEGELASRRAGWQAPEPYYRRGYGAIFARPPTRQTGLDFDVLRSGPAVSEPDIH